MANPIPEEMHTVTPYLVFQDCAKAIDFYKRAFGADEKSRVMAPDGKSVWHCHLKIGDSSVFMSDEMPQSPIRTPGHAGASTSSMWLYVEDCDAAYRRAVQAGAKSTMEPDDMFWGDRLCAVVDPFGYHWNISTHVRDTTEDEMRRGAEEFARRMQSQASGSPSHGG